MKTQELRQAYLEFFKQRGHRVYPSDSLIPVGDASLLFTGAGMNQFKPYFLGLKKDLKRAASCQKCLRTADLDRVGKTDYHHTFFEMLGNFSFGDYFKKEAIAWGWEFVTKVLKLPEDRLWVSVYEEDPEAYEIWKNEIGLPESKIVKMGPEDNFWPANAPKDGPNGPCGPCSEIYVGEVPGKGVEIWNLVFTQFDRQSDGSLLALPQKNIDTGMGLERTASILQGVKSNFDTDTFVQIRAGLKTLLKDGSNAVTAENAVMDHVRAAVFSIADGALPSNEGRGYVIRKLIRLSCDHLERAGSRERGLVHEVVPMVTQAMGEAYPELVRRQNEIMSVVQNEQRMYEEARRRASNARQGTMTSAEYAFSLYDTYGLPLDSIREKLAQENVAFDETGYQALLEGQKERSRSSSKIAGEIFAKSEFYDLLEGIRPTRFMGYTTTHGAGELLLILKDGQKVDSVKTGDSCVFVFDQSPFYAESGGQVADLGVVRGAGTSAEVVDTQSHEKVILHHVKITQGVFAKGQSYSLIVEPVRRGDVMKNHTATHLLHSALRKVLGDHVKQSGSLVAAGHLRFDFTHFSAVEPEQITKIENMVNEQVRRNATLEKKVMSKDEAVKQGAIAFFGEKYGDEVRVVSMGDFSKELCGGTHLSSTGEIELFKITSESSIQAGVRRIEALTGRWAKKHMGEAIEAIERLAVEFKVKPELLAQTLKDASAKVRTLQERLEALVEPRMRKTYDEAFAQAPQTGAVRVFERREPDATPDLFQRVFAHLKNTKEPFVILWQCGKDGKVSFVVGCSADLAARGFHAGKIVKDVAQAVEGNGGGRPDFAVGGGKRSDKAEEAMALGRTRITDQLAQLKEV